MDRQTGRWRQAEADRQMDRQTGRCRQAARQTGRQADGPADRQMAGRQAWTGR